MTTTHDPRSRPDSKGFLHVIIGGHHDSLCNTGEAFAPTTLPNGRPSRLSRRRPTPYSSPAQDDTLYITGRHDQGWAGMDFYAKPPGGDWEYRGLLVTKQERFKYYAAYHNAMAWGPKKKTLHMSVAFFLGDAKREGEHNRDPQGLVQAVGYMRSDDSGQSWTKADGTLIEIPATTDTLDLVDYGERSRDATDKPKPGIQHCGLTRRSTKPPLCRVHSPHAAAWRDQHGHARRKGGWAKRPLRRRLPNAGRAWLP